MSHRPSVSRFGQSFLSVRLFIAVMAAVAGLGFALLAAPQPAGAQECPGAVYDGVCFPSGDVAFADATVLLERGEIGSPPNGDETSPLGPPDDPTQAGGPPATPGSVSLGNGGTLIVQFTDNVLSGSGTPEVDLWIFESGTTSESAAVAVSADGATWTDLGTTSSQNAGFDLDAYGFDQSSQLAYVRVIDTMGDPDSTGPHQGADIDAVGAITTVATPPPGGTCNGLTATIVGAGVIAGSSGHEVILGSPGDDVITGSSGHDTICGNGGNDVIDGDSGNDIIIGSGTLTGDSGNDTITATDANSAIEGGSGNDICTGAAEIVDCEG